MHPLRRPRHIAISLVLFGLLSGGGLVGVAMATDEGQPVPVPFAFAEPRGGDRGVYDVTSDADAWAFGRIERGDGRITFEHRGRSIVHDINGIPRVVDEIAFDDDRYDDRDFWGAPGHTATLVEAVSKQVIANVDEWNQHEEDDEDDVGLARVVRFHDDEYRYQDDLPCGLVQALQGKTLMAGVTVPGTDCNGNRLAVDSVATFEVDAVDEDGGAAQVSLWDDRGQGRTYLVAQMLFVSGIPYPVSVELHDRGDEIGQLRLVGFDAGDDALPEPTSFAMPSPVALQVSPRTPWLFDESGIDHPFPMSEAVTHAQQDSTQGLGAWLDERPDAYIVDASYWDYESDPDRIEWRITYREQQDLYHLHIGKRFAIEDDSPAGLDELVGDVDDEAPVYYYFSASTRDVEDYGLWYPAPDALPTVASMWALYDVHARPEMTANMWEITILGGDEGNRVIIDAGRWRDYTAGRDEGSTYSRDWSFISVDLEHQRANQFSDRGYDKPAGAMTAQAEVTTQAFSAVAVPDFLPFTAKQAATVGGGAAVLALLYYLLPLLKGSGLALFSRVRKDDALDHPTRQRIVDFVAANPGCHHQAMLRALGLARGTGQHHLAKLEATEHLVSVTSSGFKCYFLRGQQNHWTMHAHGVVKSAVAQGIVQRLQEGPAATGALANELGVKPATISYHLKRLREAGLVTDAPGGHMATPEAAAL